MLAPRGRWSRMRLRVSPAEGVPAEAHRDLYASGAVTVSMFFFSAIFSAIRGALGTRSLSSAFAGDGFWITARDVDTGFVSPRIVEGVGMDSARAVPDHRPSLEQLQPCWPRGLCSRRAPPPPEPVPVLGRSHRLANAPASSAPASADSAGPAAVGHLHGSDSQALNEAAVAGRVPIRRDYLVRWMLCSGRL